MAILLTESELKALQDKGVEVGVGWFDGRSIRWRRPVTRKALVVAFWDGRASTEFSSGTAQYIKYMAFHNGGKVADFELRVGKIGGGGDRWFIEIHRRLMLRRVKRVLGV